MVARRSFRYPYPPDAAPRSALMSRSYRLSVRDDMARSTFPTSSVAERVSRTSQIQSAAGARILLATPLRQQEELDWTSIAFVAPRCAPSPDKQIKLFSKPSPIRPSSPSRTCGCSKNFERESTGAADCDERNLGRHRQLADGFAAGFEHDTRECSALCEAQTTR